MQRVRLLRHYGIHPYIVFDGEHLPAKRGTEEGRRRRRMENLACANALAAKGKHSQTRVNASMSQWRWRFSSLRCVTVGLFAERRLDELAGVRCRGCPPRCCSLRG